MSYCLISKKPVNTLLFAIYFSFIDIKQTVSTCAETPSWMSVIRENNSENLGVCENWSTKHPN